MNWPAHGSNPHYLYEYMGIEKPDHLIDFSANINPFGPPQRLKDKWSGFFHKIIDYPDPYGRELITEISKKEQIPEECILLGNGGAELITMIGRLLAGKKVLIVQPAFSEYDKACRTNGCEIEYVKLGEPDWGLDAARIIGRLDDVHAVFLCNPNNPTGVLYSEEEVLKLSEGCSERGVYLIIDEAFYDFAEEYRSLSRILLSQPRLILLRSLTKMFAIPGLRLGYALANKPVIDELAVLKPHWSVNGIALEAGKECFGAELFIEETIQYTKQERKKLFAFFKEYGFSHSPSKVNFYLLRDPLLDDPLPLFQFLLEKGIVPRHTMNFPGLDGKWLRFAVKKEEENRRLMEVLTEWRRLR